MISFLYLCAWHCFHNKVNIYHIFFVKGENMVEVFRV